MRKFFKWFAIIIGGFILMIGIVLLVMNESKPIGQSGPAAEKLANKMLDAVNKAAWDTTGVIQWTFADRHDFLWDKERHFTKVTWEDYEVLLDINNITGKVYQKNQEITGEAAQKLLKTAWDYFNNDSFWLCAPMKVFDPYTRRTLVDLEDGSKGLLVHYDSGGTTPGDSYLWILDERGKPKAWKMWVSIIPVGGLEFSWEDWKILPTGANIPTLHKSAIFDLVLSDVRGARDLVSFGLKEDPFQVLVQ